jgi:hypothetical protein
MKHDILPQAIKPLPPPGSSAVSPHKAGNWYVLQIELVRPADSREALRAELRRLGHLIESTPAFEDAKRDRKVVTLNQENGFTVVFFDEPNSSVECAVELSTALSEPSEMTVRIGITTGFVTHTIGCISGWRFRTGSRRSQAGGAIE